MRGTFIVIDGPDRCGKDEVVKFLKLHFPDAVYAREPGGTDDAERVRDIVKHPASKLNPLTQLCLFFAARSDLLEKAIRPALENGKHCILPRSDSSTLAYQVEGEGKGDKGLWNLFWTMREECFGSCKPNLYILLDVPVEISRGRPESEGDEKDYFEQQQDEDHEKAKRIQLGFLKFHHVNHTPTVVVDAAQPLEVVQQEVLKIIREEIAYKQKREAGAY